MRLKSLITELKLFKKMSLLLNAAVFAAGKCNKKQNYYFQTLIRAYIYVCIYILHRFLSGPSVEKITCLRPKMKLVWPF